MENNARPIQQSVNNRELNHNDLLIANEDVSKAQRILDGNHISYSLEERLKPLVFEAGRIPGQYIVVIHDQNNPKRIPDFSYIQSVASLLKDEDIPASYGKQSFTTSPYEETDIDDTLQQGSNARRISSTFKKNLPIRPRAVTGSIDERDPNVLNLREQQKEIERENRELNSPDIYDELAQAKRNNENEEQESVSNNTNEPDVEAAQQINEQSNQYRNQQTPYPIEEMDEPSFPVIILTFAILKDIIDVFLAIGIETVALFIVAEIFSAIFAVFIFLWLFNKPKSNNRSLFKKQVRGAIASFLVKETPIIQAFPTETLFILWVYISEKREVRKINTERREAQLNNVNR